MNYDDGDIAEQYLFVLPVFGDVSRTFGARHRAHLQKGNVSVALDKSSLVALKDAADVSFR